MVEGAAFETRPPVAEFMPRLRGTALLARVPVAELGPWPRGRAHEARVPFVGTASLEFVTDGVGAPGLVIEAICAAILDRLAEGARTSREKEVSHKLLPAAGSRVPYRH